MKTQKRSRIAAVAALTVVIGAAQTQAGLLRHFKLDEPMSSTTMIDSVGIQNGTYIGSPTLNGEVLTLNGVDQRAELSSTGTGIFNVAYETNRSLAMWINLDSVGTDQFLLGTTVPAGGHGWSFRLLSDGTLNLIRHGQDNNNSTVASGIAADTWTHVGYSLSGTTLKFYVNGVQLGADESTPTSFLNNPGTPVISIGAGGGDPSPTSFTAGSFADVRFYVNGFGPNDNDPDVANENGGVLSASDFAALAALNPVPAPAALPAGLAMLAAVAVRRRRR